MRHLTNYLKFEYVWIDALCIMQDSRDDWAMEAQVMHQIYENSECTLSRSTISAPSFANSDLPAWSRGGSLLQVHVLDSPSSICKF